MDFFKNVTIEDFNTRFLTELNAVTEFVQHNDPDEFFDPEQEYGDHIMRCQENELDFIRNTMKANMAAYGITISEEDFTEIFQSKREEIIRSRPNVIDHYIERITVTYVDQEQREHKQSFLLYRYLYQFWKGIKSIIHYS